MEDAYSYYMTQRPPMPGAMPKKGLLSILEYGKRRYIPIIGREAYALIAYDRKLTEKEISDYELVEGDIQNG